MTSPTDGSTSHPPTLIQTNHGISYPFVGPARIGQDELIDRESDRSADRARSSKLNLVNENPAN